MSKRGPKPKPPGDCKECSKNCKLKRGYCDTCYARLLRKGVLHKLPKKALPQRLSKLQQELIVGALLGDGCLYRRKVTHKPYFAVQRTAGDKQYSEWQVNILDDFVCRFYDGGSYDRRTKETYEWVKFVTHRTKVFEELYESWYPHGKKVVPSDIKLTPLSLAVWLADDGYVRSLGSPWRLQIKLSTHGFDIKSVEVLCSLLENRYNEYFGITLEGGKKPIIYGADSAARAMLLEIDNCFPESMLRKTHWRNPEVRFYENLPEKGRSSMHLRKSCKGKRSGKN